MKTLRALRRAIDAAGSQAALADRIGVAQQTISVWVRRSKRVPAEHVQRVARATGVPPEALRPDLYPRAGRGA